MKRNLLKITIAVLILIVAVSALSSCEQITISRNEQSAYIEAVDKLNNAENGAGKYILISFPGLGIEPFVVNNLAFSIGRVNVYWAGIILVVAILLAFAYAFVISRREKYRTDDVIDFVISAVVGGVVGGRLFYVLTSLDKFAGKPFWRVFMLWDGGTSVIGALMGGALAILIAARIKKMSAIKMLDIAAPAMMLGQIVGRWGNFINGESYGYELREGSPLYFVRMGIYPHTAKGIEASSSQFANVHPAFLYESVWNLVGFAAINILYFRMKKKYDGLVLYLYMIWYGLGRTLIELIRVDSLYMLSTIRASAFFAILIFFAGIALLVYGIIHGKKVKLAGEAYESAFPMFRTEASKVAENNDDDEAAEIEEDGKTADGPDESDDQEEEENKENEDN